MPRKATYLEVNRSSLSNADIRLGWASGMHLDNTEKQESITLLTI
jgi:hypothetical protein